jgi:GNAT superfamily N-acetyltransferase
MNHRLDHRDLLTLSILLDEGLEIRPELIEAWLATLCAEYQHLVPQLRQMLTERAWATQSNFMQSGPRVSRLEVAGRCAGQTISRQLAQIHPGLREQSIPGTRLICRISSEASTLMNPPPTWPEGLKGIPTGCKPHTEAKSRSDGSRAPASAEERDAEASGASQACRDPGHCRLVVEGLAPARHTALSPSSREELMQRLLERLDRRLKWTLIAPQPEVAPEAALGYPALLQRALHLRTEVGLTPDQPEPRHSFSAAGVWHLIATDPAGEIAGTVRVYVIDRQREPLTPLDIARIGHVVFPSDDVREEHMQVLRRYFKEKSDERYFMAAGGLFTTPAWRGSGLAALLGVAAIAMARIHDCRFSAAYTAVRGHAQDLFNAFGGKPPTLANGLPLGPFLCGRHGIPAQLLTFDSCDPGPRAAPGVQPMVDRLRALMPRQEQAA